MTREIYSELIDLFEKEVVFRKKWRAAVAALSDLVDPITEHIRDCERFWRYDLGTPEEITIVLENRQAFRIAKPDSGPASFETHLPYGINYTDTEVFSAIASFYREPHVVPKNTQSLLAALDDLKGNHLSDEGNIIETSPL